MVPHGAGGCGLNRHRLGTIGAPYPSLGHSFPFCPIDRVSHVASRLLAIRRVPTKFLDWVYMASSWHLNITLELRHSSRAQIKPLMESKPATRGRTRPIPPKLFRFYFHFVPGPFQSSTTA